MGHILWPMTRVTHDTRVTRPMTMSNMHNCLQFLCLIYLFIAIWDLLVDQFVTDTDPLSSLACTFDSWHVVHYHIRVIDGRSPLCRVVCVSCGASCRVSIDNGMQLLSACFNTEMDGSSIDVEREWVRRTWYDLYTHHEDVDARRIALQ